MAHRRLREVQDNRPTMGRVIDAFLNCSEFKMDMAGVIAFQKWESGFDGFFCGEPRNMPGRTKQSLEGWDAAKVVSEYKERV